MDFNLFNAWILYSFIIFNQPIFYNINNQKTLIYLGNIFLLIGIIIIKKYKIYKLSNGFNIFIFILLFTNLFNFYNLKSYFNVTQGLAGIAIVLINYLTILFGYSIYKKKGYRIFFKNYEYIINIFISISVFQIILKYIFSTELILKNNFFRLLEATSGSTLYRISTIFSEPSYLSKIIIPFLIYTLFYKENLKKSIILIIILVFSTSSLGIVFSFFMILLYFFKRIKKKNILILLLSIGTIFVGLNIQKIQNISILERTFQGATINHRLKRGIDIYKNLDNAEKIKGLGINQIGNYIKYGQIKKLYYGANTKWGSEVYKNKYSDYMSTFFYIAISSGALSIGMYLFFILYEAFNMKNFIYRIFLLYIFYVQMFDLELTNNHWVYSFTLLLIFKDFTKHTEKNSTMLNIINKNRSLNGYFDNNG